MSKLLLHIDYTQYRRFVELYGQYYYGDENTRVFLKLINFFMNH